MKNALNYYYDIITDDIHQVGRQYFFQHEGYQHALIPYYGDIKEVEKIYKVHLELLQQGLYCHQIIINQQQQILTKINDIPYILMRIYIQNRQITITDLLYFSKISYQSKEANFLIRDQWSLLWSQKIDYFEYQLSQIGKKYPLIRESFSYFAGLTETAIQLVNSTKEATSTRIIAHKRVGCKDTLLQLYNPLNLVLDLRVRDISEYYKDQFFHNYDIWDDLKQYFETTPLNQYEYIMFFARMMYPSYYFDVYEKILLEHVDETLLKPIINKVQGYEQLLKQLYYYLKNYTIMPEIEWLIKT